MVFYDPVQINWLASWIEALIPEAVTFDAHAPSLWRDIGEGLLLTVAYQL
jgi:cardiolipin synthase